MGLCRTSYGIPSSDRGDTPPVTGGDSPPSPAATPSHGSLGITTGPDPEISSLASPPSSLTTPSPTLGRGKRQNKAPSILKDYFLLALSSVPTRLHPMIQSGVQPCEQKLMLLKQMSHADHTLFTYRKGEVFLSVLVYVDDLILIKNNSIAYSSFKQYLNDCFKLKDLGPLKYFLGIEAARGPRGLFLSQGKYALDILSKSDLSAPSPLHSLWNRTTILLLLTILSSLTQALSIAFLSRTGFKVSHCPAAAMRMLPIDEMLDASICVSLGTDGAMGKVSKNRTSDNYKG
ncbi:hypothetical protein RJ639_024413 [Escallonia herrerae]|uniref:Reverse transcriptase Ty1/copia-type domain-containing protein n=1 Tax=Escallonia herrerae TaxID=1293975 RepID=A0AA88V0X9_9ASTE|nr:hypothetical protein RJ639_024413 [Escallonia herrerae]